MTQALIASDEQIRAVAATLSPEQVAILLRAYAPQVQGWSAFEATAEALANRLAGNGLTPDLARYWAQRLEEAAGDDPRDATKGLIDALVPAFHANGVTAAEGKVWEHTIMDALGVLRKPDATIINVTAKDVTDVTAKDVTDTPPEPPSQQSWTWSNTGNQ